MGPLFDENEKFIGDQLLQNIIKEKYALTHMAGIDYGEINKITVLERRMLLKILQEEVDQKNKSAEELSQKLGRRVW